MKKIPILLLALLLSTYCFAQTSAAKLRSQIASATGTKKVDLLLKVDRSIFAWKSREVDSTYFYTKLAYDEAKKINYLSGQAKAASKLADWAMYFSRNYAQALTFAADAVKLGEDLKSNTILSQAYYKYGEALQFQNREKNFDEALGAYKKAAAAYKVIGDKRGEGQASWNICGMLSGKGNYQEGLSYCQNALNLTKSVAQTEKKKTPNYEWAHQLVQFSLLNIANLYIAAGDHETTKSYINQTIAYNKKYSVSYYPDDVFAALYIKMKEPDEAQKLLDKTPPQHRNHFYFQNLQGQVFLLKNNFKQAIELLMAALPQERKENRFHSYTKILVDLATAYSGLGDYSGALKYADEAVKEAEQYNIRPYLLEAYQLLTAIHKAMNNHKVALEYLEKYISLKESMLNNQFYWRLNNLKTAALDAKHAAELALLLKNNQLKDEQLKQQLLLKQQSEIQLTLLDKDNKIKDQQLQLKDQSLKEQQFLRSQKESMLALLDKDNKLKGQQLKQQAILRNALLGGLFLLLALGFFAFRFIAQKQKNERLRSEKKQAELQQQSTELEMQALRAQMNPHFIFNCLSSINKFILKNESRAASDYLTRFSRLIRTVLTNSQLSKIPLSDEVEMLRLYLEMERLRFNNSFDYNISYENAIDPEVVYIPPMILQPVCENAIWHGLMHKEGNGRLQVKLALKKGWIECLVTDNGVGRKKAAELKSKNSDHQKSFGLKITTERLALFNEQQQGSYEVTDLYDDHGNAAGTSVRLLINTRSAKLVREKESV